MMWNAVKWMQASALSVSLSFSLTSEVVLSRALVPIVAFFSFAATNFAKTADLWLLHLISGVKVERGGGGSRRWLNKHLRHPRSFHLQNEKKTLLDVSCVQCVSAYVCVILFFGILLRRDPLPAVYQRRWPQQYFGYLSPLAHTPFQEPEEKWRRGIDNKRPKWEREQPVAAKQNKILTKKNRISKY